MSNKNELELLVEKAKTNIINDLNKIKELDLKSEDDCSIDSLHKWVMNVSSASDQVTIISDILSGIKNFCSRTAIFLIKDDKFKGWGGAGFTKKNSDLDEKSIKKVFFSLTADTVFKEVIKTKTPYSGEPNRHNDNHLLFNRFGGNNPSSIFVIPFFVKGKPQAVLYCDALDGAEIDEKEIEIISRTGEMSLDLLPYKQKIIARVKTQEYEDEQEEKPSDEPILLTEEPEPPKKTKSGKLTNAERLAKVIVNDIILYNKKQVEDARDAKKLFDILGDTIMQSKEIYLNKFDDLAPFETQLLETLAMGDREALKGYKFEAI